MRKVTKFFKTKATSIDEDNKRVTFKISDDLPDRDNEIVDQKSWDFKEYMDNPQFLWGHNPKEPDNVLGRCIKLWSEEDDGVTSTYGTYEFDTDINPRANLIFNQIKRGSLRTVSVGFESERETLVGKAFKLLGNKLYETSVVAIPANPRAIVRELQAGVITKKDAAWLTKSMQDEIEYVEKHLEQTNDKDDNVEMNEQVKQLLQQNGTLLEAITKMVKGQAATNKHLESLTTKGPVADILNAGDPWLIEDAKWDNLAPLSAMYYAFCEAYTYSGTPVDSFEDLLKEFIGLASQLLDGSYDGKAAGQLGKVMKDLDQEHVKAMVSRAMTKQAATDDPADKDDPTPEPKDDDATDPKPTDKDAGTTVTKDADDPKDKPKKDDDDESDKDKKPSTTDDPANGGDDDQPGAGDGDDEDIDLDADLTPELQEKIDSELQKALAD